MTGPRLGFFTRLLEDAPAAYKEFDAGSAYKYVIDPHGSVRH